MTLNPCIDKTIDIEEFCEGGLNRVQKVRYDAGGKGINVAKVLKNFNVDVLATGIIGETGSDLVMEELNERQILSDFLVVPGFTRTNYKLFDKSKQKITEINEPGLTITEQDFNNWLLMMKKHLPKVEILVLSGSLPKGISSNIYNHLILLARRYNVKVILDADGERFKKGIEAVPYAIKPNVYELEQLCGEKINGVKDILMCGKEILQQGVTHVIVSMGAEGAVFMNQAEAYYVRPEAIECKSTVGAGDSMVAALAYAEINGLPLKEIAKVATVAGTITAGKAGADVCAFEEVLSYGETLLLEKLN